MRRVKNIGWLLVKKQRPKPVRKLMEISRQTFLDRLSEYKHHRSIPTRDVEEIFSVIADKTIYYKAELNEFDIFFTESFTRFVFFDNDYRSKNINLTNITLEYYCFKRGKASVLVLVDTMKKESYVFAKYDRTVKSELDIWEMSDLNYWS